LKTAITWGMMLLAIPWLIPLFVPMLAISLAFLAIDKLRLSVIS
jgi:hypothetical protein